MKTCGLMMPVATMLALLVSSLPAMADHCIKCHSQPELKVQNKKLFDYYQDFKESIHGVVELSCTDCHGGDDSTDDLTRAHEGVLENTRFDRIPSTCGECHDAQYEAFVTSDHYRLLEEDGSAPNCITCHGAMEMDFVFASRVRNTCAFCHNQESENAPGVPDQADYILGKINIMRGYRSFVRANLRDPDRIMELDRDYLRLTARWHRFDLDSIELEMKDLLARYRKAKVQAFKDRRDAK